MKKKSPTSSTILCWYCGKEIFNDTYDLKIRATRDHQIPKSRGGTGKKNNMVDACHPCNTSKNKKTVDEFREYIRWKKSPFMQTYYALFEALSNYPEEHSDEYRKRIWQIIVDLNSITPEVYFYGERRQLVYFQGELINVPF